MNKKKAQVWSADFIVSAIIFFLAFIILVFCWDNVTRNAQEQAIINDLESSVLEITDILVRSPGLPEDWEYGDSEDIQSIGLVSEENKLDETKIESFMDIDYSKTKRLLGITNYEFYFDIRDLRDEIVEGIAKGEEPTDAVIVIPLERYALYNDDIVKLKFVFWSRYL